MAEEQHWEANHSAYGKVKISFLLQKWHLAYDTDDNVTKNLLHDIYEVCVSIKLRKAIYLGYLWGLHWQFRSHHINALSPVLTNVFISDLDDGNGKGNKTESNK